MPQRRRDRDSGKFLPAWMGAHGGIMDPDGNYITNTSIRASIWRAFRNQSNAQDVDYLRLEALEAAHAGRSKVGRLSDGEIEILTRWIHVPAAWYKSRKIRIDDILGHPTGEGPVQPWNIVLHDVHMMRPISERARRPHTTFHVVHRDQELTAREERLLHNVWLVTEDRDCYHIFGSDSYRKVAPLHKWRGTDPSLPKGTEACAETLLQMSRNIGIRLAQTPAQMACAFARSFQTGPWAMPSHQMYADALNIRPGYAIAGPTVKGTINAWVYDLNSAYAAWLRCWPDLSDGEWQYVTRYTGPFGIYTHSWRSLAGDPTGLISGQAIEEGRGSEPWDEIRTSIIDGWAWQPAHAQADTPMLAFCEASHVYRGEGQGIVHRFPALYIGKTKSSFWDGDDFWGHSAYYTPIWANVIEGLSVHMSKMMTAFHPHMVYIDCLHVQEPLPESFIGKGVGQWKEIDHGPTRYDALGNWHSPHFSKHQGRA